MDLSDPQSVFNQLYSNQITLADLYRSLQPQSDIVKYLYLKSIKLVDSSLWDTIGPIASSIDDKQVLRDILTMYGTDKFSLQYNHVESEGLPNLHVFVKIIKQLIKE